MTAEQAYSILGITSSDTVISIKRKYHALLHQYHPDNESGDPDAAMQVIEAFRVVHEMSKNAESTSVNLPAQNLSAFCERTLFSRHNIFEDEPEDIFSRGRGKFFWDPDYEEFDLFLKSVLMEAKTLTEDSPEKMKRTFHLLVQDFIRPLCCLQKICDSYEYGYYCLKGRVRHPLASEQICRLQGSRIYAAQEQLSFDDDSCYYILAMLIARNAADVISIPADKGKVSIRVRISDPVLADRPGNARKFM